MLSAIEGGCPHPHRHRHCTTCDTPAADCPTATGARCCPRCLHLPPAPDPQPKEAA